jgi:hypothetical protein
MNYSKNSNVTAHSTIYQQHRRLPISLKYFICCLCLILLTTVSNGAELIADNKPKEEPLTAFSFDNCLPNRRGFIINTTNKSLQGKLELRRNIDVMESKPEPAYLKTIWTQTIKLSPHQRKIIIIPLASDTTTSTAFFFTPDDKRSLEKLHTNYNGWKSISELVILGGNNIKSSYLIKGKDYKHTLYGTEDDLPEKVEDYFFSNLIIGIKEFNNLPKKTTDNILLYVAQGGAIFLVDNIPGEIASPLIEKLTGLTFGSKTQQLSPAVAEVIAKTTITTKPLPNIRQVNPIDIKQPTSTFPFYYSNYGCGYIKYIAFDISKMANPLKFIGSRRGRAINQNTYKIKPLKKLASTAKRAQVTSFSMLFFRYFKNPVMTATFILLLIYIGCYLLLFRQFKKAKTTERQMFIRVSIFTVLFIISVIACRMLLNNNSMSYHYIESETLYPATNRKEINNTLSVKAHAPATGQLQWLGNIPQIVSTQAASFYNNSNFKKLLSDKQPRLKLGIYENKLFGSKSWVATTDSIQSTIFIAKNGTITGTITNQTEYEFQHSYLIIPYSVPDNSSSYSYKGASLTLVVPLLSPGQTYKIPEKISIHSVQPPISPEYRDIIEKYHTSHSFIGMTQQFFFLPTLAQNSTPENRLKLVIQRLDINNEQTLAFTSSSNPRLSDKYSDRVTTEDKLPLCGDKIKTFCPKTTKLCELELKILSEAGDNNRPKNKVLKQQLLNTYAIVSDTLYQTNVASIDFSVISEAIAEVIVDRKFYGAESYVIPKQGTLAIEVLNLYSGQWEKFYSKTYKKTVTDRAKLAKLLTAYRNGTAEKEITKNKTDKLKLAKKELFDGKHKLSIKLTNMKNYIHTGEIKLYFRLSLTDSNTTVNFSDADISYTVK